MRTDYQKAIQLVQLNRYQEAKELLIDLLANDPEGDHILLLLARIAHIEDNHQECIQHSQSVLALQPDIAEAVYLRGISHCYLEESAKGIKLIEEAIEMEPEEGSYKIGLAQVLIEINYLKEAEDLCRDVLYYDSEDAHAFALLAYLAQERGNKKEAKAFRDEALRLDPFNNGIKALVGNLNLADEDRLQSAALLREAVIHYPEKKKLREKLIDTELSKENGIDSWIVMKYNLFNVLDYSNIVICLMVAIAAAAILDKILPMRLISILLMGLTIWQIAFWSLRLVSHFAFYRTEWKLGLRDFINSNYLIHIGMILFSVSFFLFLLTHNFLWIGTSLMLGILALMVLSLEEKLEGKKELIYARVYIGGIAAISLLNFIAYWNSSPLIHLFSRLLFLSIFGVAVLAIFYELIAEVISQVKDRPSSGSKKE